MAASSSSDMEVITADASLRGVIETSHNSSTTTVGPTPGAAGCSRGESSLEMRHGDAIALTRLPEELFDRILGMLPLEDLANLVQTCRFGQERLQSAITACAVRLGLSGYSPARNAVSIPRLLAQLDSALPRLPRVIVVKWLDDMDWRVRLASLRALSLHGGGSSFGDSANVKDRHGEAIAALQEDEHIAVRAAAAALYARLHDCGYDD